MIPNITKPRLQRNEAMAEICADSDLATALSKAKTFSGEHGFVASLPDLLYYGYYGNGYVANSQEYLLNTPLGHQVLMVVHGDGILSDPERLRNAIYEPISKGCGIRLTDAEVEDLLCGVINGEEIPIYPYADIDLIPKSLVRYAVALDFSEVISRPSGRVYPVDLHECSLFGARTVHEVHFEGASRFMGWYGKEDLSLYVDDEFIPFLDSITASVGGKLGMGIMHQHPYHFADPKVSQGHFLFLGDKEHGLTSGFNQYYAENRFVGICSQVGQWMSPPKNEAPSAKVGSNVRNTLVELAGVRKPSIPPPEQ